MGSVKDKSSSVDNRVRRSNIFLVANPVGEEKMG